MRSAGTASRRSMVVETIIVAFLAAVLFGWVNQSYASSTCYLSPTGSDSAGDGSRERPWKTIRFAIEKVADDGSTVVLLDGLYEGTQSVDRHFSKECLIKAETPYRARLRSPADQNRVLFCYDASHVRFQGLEMFGSGGVRGEYLIHIGTPNAHNLTFDDCIIHDCYNNDLIKINDGAHDILFRNCIFFNQTDHGGDEHFDINTVTDIAIENSIFFNDYAGSGRQGKNQSHAFIVVKNSGSTPDVTQRIALRRNIFLNWQGLPDEAFILLGEDGKPFYEAQDVVIENNLFIHNSPVRMWGTLLLKGGLRNMTIRANTIVGHPAVQWSGAFAAVFQRIEQNQPMGDLSFSNNICCDSSAAMPRFSDSSASLFAVGSKQIIDNNLYWNGGKAIPVQPTDVLTPDRDARKRIADPRLPASSARVVLPRPDNGRFLSGRKTIREEFERLVRAYAALGEASPAIGTADAASMPADDILGQPRGQRPDIGCFQRSDR